MSILLGTGKASGMMYHAPAGTTLPTNATEAIPEAWQHVGDVSDEGITLAISKTTENIKNWANQIKRVVLTDHEETIKAGIIDTSAESLSAVFGEGNVTITAATSTHGAQVSVQLSASDLPAPEAWLFAMKDGDNLMMIGTTSGQVSSVDDVAFQPGGAITWTPTITTIDGWTLLNDDGQVTA